ncbi:hypothetical protein QYM36_018311 [Artemia franciscana]|uniref:Uncharacterized protein n=1 Tax=Artemia franciscana TaxID=6661 RepID=A0AA88L0I7_ARTSF|nr:hypothetical protein QYM36_018311 [Artemia franciscana]
MDTDQICNNNKNNILWRNPYKMKSKTPTVVKQDPGADLGTTVLDIAKKMAINVQKEQVLWVNRFRLTNVTASIQTPTPIAPVDKKCFVMMTGELNYINLKYKEKPFVSEYIFLMFVFLVTIVLLIFGITLAISDTQIIRKEAEIVSCANQIEMIYYYESMFYDSRQCSTADRSLTDAIFNQIRQFFKVDKMLLFDRCLLTRNHQVYPNYNQESTSIEDKCICHSNYRIDKDIVCEALEIGMKETSLA